MACQKSNIHDGKGFANGAKVQDFITPRKKSSKKKSNNRVKKCSGGLMGLLGLLLLIALMILAWLFGRYNGEQNLDDATRESIIQDIMDQLVGGNDTEGDNIRTRSDINKLLNPLCDRDYGSYNLTKGMSGPGSELGFIGVFGVLTALACKGVDGAFQGLYTSFLESSSIRDINTKFKKIQSRLDLLDDDATVGDLLVKLDPDGRNTLKDLDEDMLAAEAVNKAWSDEIARENEPYNLALIKAVVPFILRIRKANGINNIRDIMDTPLAPLIKIYDSRIDFALLDLFNRSPIDFKNRSEVYDQSIEALKTFDPYIFDKGVFNVRHNKYFSDLAKYKVMTKMPLPLEPVKEDLTLEEKILLVQT